MLLVTLTSLIFLANVLSVNAGTNFDASWTHVCPKGQSISHISSVHSNRKEDRSWTFRCRASSVVTSSCSWSGYVNSFDAAILYQCPNGVITGVSSYHSNHHEDRRFNFRCCVANSYSKACGWTGYLNDWDGYLSYDVRYGHYLVGVSSYHSNSKEDRRWKFLTC